MSALPRAAADWCLFLDFDGTLVELRDHPAEVTVPTDLRALLRALADAFAGAVAIISGRRVGELERLLEPLELPLAGIHGLERRAADGSLHRDESAERALARVRDAVADFVERHDGLYWEDKGGAFAVHFRRAPEHGAAVREFLQRQRDVLDGDFHLQAGKAVYELKPAGRDKGRAVSDFMHEAPFAGRVPVFVGDDVTDEDAFEAVNALGGISVRIGAPAAESHARYRIESVGAALAWLASLPAQLPAVDTRPGATR